MSKLILGTVQFGLNYGIANVSGKPSEESVCRILETAAENGITLLDTAAAYGESEAVLGRTLHTVGLAEKMDIVSKIPPVPEDLSLPGKREFIRNSLFNSLKNLRTGQLYALLFHREADWQYGDFILELCEEKLVRYAGCSVDGTPPVQQEKLQALQIPGNLLDRRFSSFAAKAHDRGCQVFVRSVYLQGLLLMPEEKIPVHLQDAIPYRRSLTALAGENGMSLAELAMRYLFSFDWIDGVLTGVDTPEQLKQNASLAALPPLPPELLRKIYSLIPELPESIIRPSVWNRKA